jgi:hypothetical protein
LAVHGASSSRDSRIGFRTFTPKRNGLAGWVHA